MEGIRDRRLRLGLSQQELAELARCSVAMLRLLEHGYRTNSSPTRKRIEAALTKAEK